MYIATGKLSREGLMLSGILFFDMSVIPMRREYAYWRDL